jgi:hypothetical protein
MDKKMVLNLGNGHSIEGTASELASFLIEIDENTPKYKSKSMGIISISGMETTHLKNAVLKKLREWNKSLYDFDDMEELVNEIDNMDIDEEFERMLEELKSR